MGSGWEGNDTFFFDKRLTLFMFIVFLFLIMVQFSSAVDYKPIDQRYIQTGQTQEWFYIQVHKADNTDKYIGVDKISRGVIGFGDNNNNLYGRIWMIPAYRFSNNWWLCPIKDVQTLDSYTDLGNGWQFYARDPSHTCYQWGALGNTQSANMSFQFNLITDNRGQTKINVNTTLHNPITIQNTGFAFMFMPDNPQEFRYVDIGGVKYDLAGVEGAVPINKLMRLLDAQQNPLGAFFDWNDMLDTGNYFSEIITVNGDKGIIIGTYGYGASYSISIDPLFTVDYSPVPAQHLINGTAESDPDSAFQIQNNITFGISDGSTSSNYETRETQTLTSDTMTVIDNGEDVYQSSNLGVTWTEKSTGYGDDASNGIGMSVATDGIFYIVTADRNVYNGTNSGTTWFKVNADYAGGFSTPTDLLVDYTNYIYISTATEDVYRSTNRGISFTLIALDINGGGSGAPIDNMAVDLDNNLYAVMNDREIYRSTNQGTSWSLIEDDFTNGAGGTLTKYMVSLDGFLYISDGQDIYESSNGGFNWTLINDDFNGGGDSNNANAFGTDGVNIYICDSSEDIWMSDDNGVSFDQQIANFNGGDGSCSGMARNSKGLETGIPKKAISGTWSQTYLSNSSFYLRVEKRGTTTRNFRIYAYDDSDNLSLTQPHVHYTASGEGYFNIPIDDLLEYMTVNQSLSYTKLRVTTTASTNISEMYLRAEGNDTFLPSIFDCQINSTLLNCSETARLICNATDDSDVDAFRFQIESVNYTGVQDNGQWYFDFSPAGYGSVIYDWEKAHAKDIFNRWNFTNVNIAVNYTCAEPCYENWTLDTINCLVNDTYIATYTDQNACGTFDDLPAQNGTEQNCNYCSEDLVQVLGACQSNSTQTVSYTDNNYFICCAVTGIPSDCSVDVQYPYNTTTYQACTFFNNTMGNITCQNEPNFNIREKEYCLAYIPQAYANESFKCIADVYDYSTNEILQTNPEYRERAQTFIEFGQDPETREYFSPAYQIVNFYYTSKNLNPENDYVLRIQCSSPQRILASYKQFTIDYEDLQFVFFRQRWLFGNAPYIIGGLIVLFIILALFFIYMRAVA